MARKSTCTRCRLNQCAWFNQAGACAGLCAACSTEERCGLRGAAVVRATTLADAHEREDRALFARLDADRLTDAAAHAELLGMA